MNITEQLNTISSDSLCSLFNSLYCRYLVTEGQIFSVYFVTYAAMMIYWIREKYRGQVLGVNGRFLFHSFTVTFVLVVVWVVWLWNDPVLRQKYPGLIYVPEPWSYYTLYVKPQVA